MSANPTGGLGAAGEFLSVLLIFVFVLAITYGTTRWIANYQRGKNIASNIKVIETFKLTANKYVQIIQTGSKYLVIVICKDTVTLLTELTEEQIAFSKLPEDANVTFKEILEKAKNLTDRHKQD